jgi:phosphatidylglycerophosphatase A
MPAKAPRWAWLVATGLGSGWLRPAPGTWGTLAALLAWCLISQLLLAPLAVWADGVPGQVPGRWTLEALCLLLPLAMSWLAVKASDRVVAETGHKDPGYIVADEWAGMWITLWPLRWEIARNLHRLTEPGGWRWLPVLLVPFLLFRLLDIWKPWPVHQIQALPGGTGVVADDVVAGLYAIPLTLLLTPIALGLLAS